MDAFERGLSDFKAGRYFEAHEAWESVWLKLPDGKEKTELQGLIQVAVAYHHLSKGNLKGAAWLLEQARGKLPARCRDVDTGPLLEELARRLQDA
jgi:predicted metal-dependent hydrolase